MRRGLLIVSLLISGAVILSRADFEWRMERNRSFSEHEHLVFAMKWQFVTVGKAVMDIRGIETVRGRDCYHVVTEASTSSFFDAFYKVRDENGSYMDRQSLCSLRSTSYQCEGSYCKMESIEFLQESGKYQILESSKTGTITPWIQDVLSALYYLRTRELNEGKTYSIDAQSGDKAWPLTVKVLKRQTVTVPAGKFDCVVVEPKLREGAGIFQAKGKLTVWLTDDYRHMPVLMRSKIAIGSIEALLSEYQN